MSPFFLADAKRAFSVCENHHRCTEPNCHSKVEFKTPSQLRQHVQNIHRHPLLCTVSGCTYRRPFGRASDLTRHVRSVHEAACGHICPYKSCPAHTRGFKRQDKLRKHLRENHPCVQCQQAHCSAIVSGAEQQSHIEKAHGPYECAIGLCRFSPASHFGIDQLERHLRVHHKSHCVASFDAIRAMQRSGSTTIRSEHLPDRMKKVEWEKCSVCVLQQIAEAVEPIGDA